MSIRYKDVVPWGRNFDEYSRMFALTESDLSLCILGCGDGPASFNLECNARGGHVTSIDPLYQFSRETIKQRIAETYKDVLRQTRANQDKFVWKNISSPEELGRIRMDTMQLFLASYENGRKQGKYIPGELPYLPFADQTFDLVLCSHFLFLYTDNLSLEFHSAAIREMLRVAREVRIFPLLDVNAQRSKYLDGIMAEFSTSQPNISRVDYEFQRGGDQMLQLTTSGKEIIL